MDFELTGKVFEFVSSEIRFFKKGYFSFFNFVTSEQICI